MTYLAKYEQKKNGMKVLTNILGGMFASVCELDAEIHTRYIFVLKAAGRGVNVNLEKTHVFQ